MYRTAHSTPAPLLGALVLLAGTCIPVGAANAATRVVSNCNDSGAGSLRAVVGAAASGDIIDLRSLGCSRILLTSGSIAVPQASLTILGRSRYRLAIDGNASDRVFLHNGTGTLRIDHLSVTNGLRRMVDLEAGIPEYGGCIYSQGNVRLHQAWVHACRALQQGFIEAARAYGGGIAAEGDVHLTWSAVFDNEAMENSEGGGIYAKGRVTLHHSQVYQNRGYIGGGIRAENGASVTYSRIYRNRGGYAGGGLSVIANDVLVNKSTISNNVAADWRFDYGSDGGFDFGDTGARHTIIDSTISNNRAHTHSAGYSQGTLDVYNSTIAYNAEITNPGGDEDPIRPCEVRGALGADVLHLESTIVARNSCVAGPFGYDISMYTGSVIGANNVIEYPRVPVPADTLAVDPRLAPLADNGGYSYTHMPQSDSPVLGQGSNLLDRAYDQRGPGFPRVKGGAVDIGSVER